MKQKFSIVLTMLAIVALTISVALPTTAIAAPMAKNGGVSESPNGVYIVQMVNEPVVGYDGGIAGYNATAPAKGSKIDPFNADVVKYVNFLVNKHTNALKVTGGKKLYDYTYSFNGFAAKMSQKQANKMAAVKGVLVVTPDELQTVDTSSTPTFLGLDAAGGLWEQLGGTKMAGEGIIIGVIDTGIWPESLSFKDRVNAIGVPSASGKLVYQQIPGWHGKCTPGERFTAAMCNQKLIGAQYFNASWGGNAGIDADLPWEFNSPRDFNGHGSHTSSTAGGNFGVPVTGDAAGLGSINGMAPRARIAMYKALWTKADGTGSGYTADLVEAIDQAVADGVDVINYSISGTQTNFRDPVEISFLYAADAGVFVAASAGNSGPTTATVAHPSPWITTVAAGTHNRNGQGSVTTGDGKTYYGASFAVALPSTPLVDAANVAAAGATIADAERCFPGTLDTSLVTGKIVLCKRGSNALVEKSAVVYAAGGVGMILYNDPAGATNLLALLHSVPTVHVVAADGLAIKAYVASTGASATASISKATIVYDVPAPLTASFSSRGPLKAGNGDLLKPDVIAPGQDILAAVAPPGNGGKKFDLYNGTSMSSPHVAGVAALLKDLHPDWSPMMIKSALMTSAYDVLDGPNTNPLVIFRQGAGHIQPNMAADPGLVYDAGWIDWLGFLCGTGMTAAYCPSIQIDPSDLNVASISIGSLAGTQTVTRKVTNVGGSLATYSAVVEGLGGIDVVVEPATLTLAPGETGTFTVTFTTTTAAMNAYVGGYLTWSDTTHFVRIPIVVKPVALAAPVQVSGIGGPISYDVTFGYNGDFTATARGLIPAVTYNGSVNTGDYELFKVVIPDGTTYARFSLFDDFVSPASDLDLYIFNSSLVQIGGSGGGSSAEEVNFLNLAAGTYYAMVDGYATGNPSTFTLFTWFLGSGDEGNMAVSAPTAAIIGTTGTINLNFSGLTAGTKYLGSIAYAGAEGMPNPTIVRVDVP